MEMGDGSGLLMLFLLKGFEIGSFFSKKHFCNEVWHLLVYRHQGVSVSFIATSQKLRVSWGVPPQPPPPSPQAKLCPPPSPPTPSPRAPPSLLLFQCVIWPRDFQLDFLANGPLRPSVAKFPRHL